MNDKPTRDDYNQLINQLGPSGSEDGPDILAVNRKKEEHRSAQPQQRTTRHASSGDRQRHHNTQNRSAAAPKAQRRQPTDRQRTAAPRGEEKAAAAPNSRRPKEKKPGFGGSAWLRAIIISLVLVAGAVTLALFVMSSATDLFGLNQEDKQVEVNVTEGMSSGDIIDLLGETGVVDQKMTFRFYAGLKDALDEFKPGHYVMNRNLAMMKSSLCCVPASVTKRNALL